MIRTRDNSSKKNTDVKVLTEGLVSGILSELIGGFLVVFIGSIAVLAFLGVKP